ncbi:cysteine--tRNA ligase [Patescibacteria group bacterium]|nr:cysteine--tRNA ligase [Patescibacteria group bacterium]
MKIYNTLTRKVEELKPISDRKINMFVCGPTVYDYAHIGNARTYINFDFFVKYLRFRGFDVFYLQNITDIDDKIIARSKERMISWETLAKEYEEKYYEDMAALGVTAVAEYARATDYIPQIVRQVKILLEKGYAYKTSDGVYYDIFKFADYGKLSGRTEADQNAGVSRIDESLDKKNKNDFALWKFSRPDEPSWETELGRGRPGWHIEDTAITEAHFGSQYDIHGAAVDLMFPHHEAEIAQMEAISGKKPLAKYWMHAAFLNMNSQKMSKSKGNFTTAREATQKWGVRLLRFFFISSHYRTVLDYSEASLEQAKGALERLDGFILKIDKTKEDDISQLKTEVLAALDNDFDTPKALAVLFDYIRDNRDKAGKNAYAFLQELNAVFGFLIFEKEVPEEIQKLINKREALRKEKKYAEADKLREEIEAKGYKIEDRAIK